MLDKKADTSSIPTNLSQLREDSTHRLVTDSEKSTWNNKLSSLSGKDISRAKTDGYNTSNVWQSIDTQRDLEDWIGDFDKRTRENKSSVSSLDSNISTKLNNKVDKISGKALSSNDYTNADKTKLSNLKEQIILTESQYNALSTSQKNDESKIYFIKE
ncbi:hypothetical protein KQI68_06530 [Peptoniphilus sp. MSJ-1]|uniref:Uncharacterized protein n=1 Tax=Peptoniphilus ovalis TaxID=2841503 RepID=A0ABS6FJ79_9FIRM|nr:hypothetical protein [Peptoniphilus ovalis]MBU5669493.1 hypothetical protein [Peptoniphilus ovalis]